MKTELAYFGVFPKIFAAGSEGCVHIVPRGRHARFAGGRVYTVTVIPMNETRLNDLDEVYPVYEAVPEDGSLGTSRHEEKHGRKETRDYAVSDDVGWVVKQYPQWKSIKSIGVVESMRDTGEGGKSERRYFISSLGADEELFAHAVRSHWGIENRLHYMLDVIYHEDACRVRKDWSPRTLGLIRKIALTIAKSDKESKTSVRGRVQQMTWSEDYLERLLFHSAFASEQNIT